MVWHEKVQSSNSSQIHYIHNHPQTRVWIHLFTPSYRLINKTFITKTTIISSTPAMQDRLGLVALVDNQSTAERNSSLLQEIFCQVSHELREPGSSKCVSRMALDLKITNWVFNDFSLQNLKAKWDTDSWILKRSTMTEVICFRILSPGDWKQIKSSAKAHLVTWVEWSKYAGFTAGLDKQHHKDRLNEKNWYKITSSMESGRKIIYSCRLKKVCSLKLSKLATGTWKGQSIQ